MLRLCPDFRFVIMKNISDLIQQSVLRHTKTILPYLQRNRRDNLVSSYIQIVIETFPRKKYNVCVALVSFKFRKLVAARNSNVHVFSFYVSNRYKKKITKWNR